MIISHAHEFVFIKTHKTAGSSIEFWLRKHLGPADIATPDHEFDGLNYDRTVMMALRAEFETPWLFKKSYTVERVARRLGVDRFRMYDHMPAARAKCYLGAERWRRYHVFCVERNPFEKAVSDYYGSSLADEMTFRDFVLSSRRKSDWDMITDRNGCILVDEVIQFKTLTSEFSKVCDKIGLNFERSFGANIHGGRNKAANDFHSLYTDETIKRVGTVCREEIEYFGYGF